MEKGNTKQMILEAALELFSVKGFEATSISEITAAVGIRKASLYSHFANKKEILDTLIGQTLETYDNHSLFATADWNDPAFTERLGELTPERVVTMVQQQIGLILHDPNVSRARKLLVVEQFQNPELSRLYEKQSYTDVMAYNTGLIRYLIARGILREENSEIMAAQFCLPISAWIGICDRDISREPEIMRLMEQHIVQFFRIYGKNL